MTLQYDLIDSPEGVAATSGARTESEGGGPRVRPSARSIATLLGFDFVDLDELELGSELAAHLPESVARQAHAVPLGLDAGRPSVAIGVPTTFESVERLRATVGDRAAIRAADITQIDRYLGVVYSNESSAPVRAGDSPTGFHAFTTPVASDRQRPTLQAVLGATGLLGSDQLETAVQLHVATGRALHEIVGEFGWISERDLVAALAETSGFTVVDLEQWDVEPLVASLIPEPLSRRHHVLAIGSSNGRPVVAISDPADVIALDDVRAVLGGDIEFVVCLRSQIDECILRTFRHNAEADIAAKSAALTVVATDSARAEDLNDLHEVVEDAPIVQFVSAILRQALSERASDVHIEPSAGALHVRFRIDGVLHHITAVPKAIQSGVITRLKVMADLDIAERRVPQDGRITLSIGDRAIDLRVATLPTVNGEKIVLRVLDRSTAPLDLDKLGFDPEVLSRYATAYSKPSGTILVTGPTGSGKSTTLYATLNTLNSPERNLITVEDPAEYQLEGINQVQVNPKAGLHFANALRSILRSDPDVLLIGEIRDRETATIAIEAALTGHLVLSCLHTSNAASTPMRLIEMGVEPFLVISSLDCVLAQRLARVLCPICSAPYTPSPEDLRAAGWDDKSASEFPEPRFRKAVGCQACGQTGYRGRVAIQEVMLLSETIERAVLARAHTDEIHRAAVAEGMRPLHQDGLRKAAMGMTTLEEIMRVVV